MKQLNQDQLNWIKTLRSGKYKRARGYLRMHDRFCCLGVWCDMQPGVVWKPVPSEGVLQVDGTPIVNDQTLAGDSTGKPSFFGVYLNKEAAEILDLTQKEQIDIGNVNDSDNDNVETIHADSYDRVIPVILATWANKGYDISGCR